MAGISGDDTTQLEERLVCNQEVEGSIPFVSTLNLYATEAYDERRNEEIKTTWAACRVALGFDIQLSFIDSLWLFVRTNFLRLAPSGKCFD
jgi:hypothetical protein